MKNTLFALTLILVGCQSAYVVKEPLKARAQRIKSEAPRPLQFSAKAMKRVEGLPEWCKDTVPRGALDRAIEQRDWWQDLYEEVTGDNENGELEAEYDYQIELELDGCGCDEELVWPQ